MVGNPAQTDRRTDGHMDARAGAHNSYVPSQIRRREQ